MSTFHTMLLLVACCVCSGCISTPPAETVATTCERNYREVRGDVRVLGSDVRKVIAAKCVDNAHHRTLAKDEVEVRRGQVTTKTEYDAKEGDERTQVATEKSVGPGYRSEVTVVRQNKYFVWGWRSKIQTR